MSIRMRISYFFLIFLAVSSCGRNRRPGLSDSELFRTDETLQQTEQEPELDFSDMETYVVPAGIKYKESRAIDPANPPMVLDIANRNLNIRMFNLGDYYTKARYVKLKHPKPAEEGNFLLDGIRGGRIQIDRNVEVSLITLFIFTDDYIVTGDACFGLHCYDREGRFLYTIESNDFPKTYDASRTFIELSASELKGFHGKFSINGNYCLFSVREDNKNLLCLYDLNQQQRIMTRPFGGSAFILDNQSMAKYVYEPVREPENFLINLDIKGDTLCIFPNYQPTPEIGGGSYNSPLSPDVYYHANRLTIRQAFNDTVYRVTSPSRLLPAYILNFGAYRADIQTFFRGNLSDKLLPGTWKESDRYILFAYTQNRDTHTNRREGNVKFFYSYYDKRSRQLYHFSEDTAIPENETFMQNPVPDALPFIFSYIDVDDNQLRVCYSKKRLEDIINHKDFASLHPEQQNKLKTIQNELEDNEVLIMILE